MSAIRCRRRGVRIDQRGNPLCVASAIVFFDRPALNPGSGVLVSAPGRCPAFSITGRGQERPICVENSSGARRRSGQREDQLDGAVDELIEIFDRSQWSGIPRLMVYNRLPLVLTSGFIADVVQRKLAALRSRTGSAVTIGAASSRRRVEQWHGVSANLGLHGAATQAVRCRSNLLQVSARFVTQLRSRFRQLVSRDDIWARCCGLSQLNSLPLSKAKLSFTLSSTEIRRREDPTYGRGLAAVSCRESSA